MMPETQWKNILLRILASRYLGSWMVGLASRSGREGILAKSTDGDLLPLRGKRGSSMSSF